VLVWQLTYSRVTTWNHVERVFLWQNESSQSWKTLALEQIAGIMGALHCLLCRNLAWFCTRVLSYFLNANCCAKHNTGIIVCREGMLCCSGNARFNNSKIWWTIAKTFSYTYSSTFSSHSFNFAFLLSHIILYLLTTFHKSAGKVGIPLVIFSLI